MLGIEVPRVVRKVLQLVARFRQGQRVAMYL
jgi:hypothetical protein